MNTMILKPQISDVIANENVPYKRNELEYEFHVYYHILYLYGWLRQMPL